MSDMISKVQFEKHVKKIKVPKGFTADMETEQRGWNNHPIPTLVYVLKGNGMEIRFDQTGSGHTLFTHEGKQLCFDRYGVEDSFYHLPFGDWDKERYNLNTIVKEQIKRVEEYLKYTKTALQVPGIPHTVSPEAKVKLIERLKKNGQISFQPSGFGTGYIVTKNMVRGSKLAPKAMATFFGFDKLFISTVEMD